MRAVGFPSCRRGFTLIEMLITLVVLGLLMAVALPSYRAQVRKSTRAEAQAYLLAVVAREQQFMLDTRAYAALGDVGVGTPANVAAAYTVALVPVVGPPPGFSLTAVPTGDQTSEPCGTLRIDHNGSRSADKTGCW